MFQQLPHLLPRKPIWNETAKPDIFNGLSFADWHVNHFAPASDIFNLIVKRKMEKYISNIFIAVISEWVIYRDL